MEEKTKKCPYCSEEIELYTKICPICGENLISENLNKYEKINNEDNKFIFLTILTEIFSIISILICITILILYFV